MKAIDESHGEVHWVSSGRVGSELVNQFGELGDIFSAGGGLVDRKELANQKLFLIAAEAVMQQAAKGGPVEGWELRREGLEPESGGAV